MARWWRRATFKASRLKNPEARAPTPGRLIAGSRGRLEWAALLALAFTLAALLIATRAVAPLDAVLHDAIVRATPRVPDPRITIVAIDDASLRSIGRWPWPRSVHARMLQRIGETFPLAVGYDILFVDPAPGDDLLRQEVAKHDTLVLPELLARPGDNGAEYRITKPVVGGTMAGHVIVTADADGVFRRVSLVEGKLGSSSEHVAAIVAGLVRGPIPTGGTLIPYTGGPGHYPTVSFDALLRGEVPPELLRERVLLVGATAAGLGDRFATPVGGERDLMAGVEVQANIVDALLHGGLRRDGGRWAAAVLATVTLVLAWAAFLRLSPRANLAAAAALVLTLMLGASVMLVVGGVWLRPAAALVTLIVVFPLWGWRRLAAASRYFAAEIDRLGEVTGTLAPTVGGDRIARQIALLDRATEQVALLRRQRDESLEFLSHDLRGPAAAILTIVPANDRVAGHARRLLRLADQFVQGARAEAAPLAIEPVELAATLDEAADACWEAAESVGGRVEVSASWELPELAVDRSLMTRAIVNLIDNALKYGGDPPVVLVRAWVGNGRALVSVADEGPGMTDAQATGMFDRFDRAGTTRAGGVGLGLALVATFARRQGGTVRCVSRPGVGTLVVLSLPVGLA